MKTTFLVLLLLVAGIVIADTTGIALKEPTAVIGQPDYELLYENQKEYNDKIQTNIYWVIGIIAVIALSQFITSVRLNNTKYIRLKTEMTSDISTVLHTAKTEVNQGIDEKIRLLTTTTEEKVSNFTTNFKEQISAISDSNKNLKSELEKCDANIDEIGYAVSRLKFESYYVTARTYLNKDEDFSLLYFLYAIRYGLSLKKVSVKRAVDDCLRILPNVKLVTKTEIDILNEIIDCLPEEYEAEKEKFRAFNEAKIKEKV